jgi:hypothetical protein
MGTTMGHCERLRHHLAALQPRPQAQFVACDEYVQPLQQRFRDPTRRLRNQRARSRLWTLEPRRDSFEAKLRGDYLFKSAFLSYGANRVLALNWRQPPGVLRGGTLSSAEIDRTGRAREQNLQAVGIDVVDGWCACSPSKGQIVSSQAAVRNVTSGPTRDAAAPGAEGLRRGRQRRAIDAQSRRLVCSCIVGESSKINALDLRTGVCNKFGNTCALRSPLSTEVRLPADPGQARRLCGEVRPVPCTAVRFVDGPYLPGNASA